MNFPLLLSIALLAQSETVDFDNDIVPILTKAGCSTAACHGSAAGRGGFKLSLYGGDPAADYDAVVRHYAGRRIQYDDPTQSLLLAKPTGDMEHGGDVRLDADGPHVAAMVRWINQGARRQQAKPKLARLEVSADKTFVTTVPATLQIEAVAVYENGQRRRVNDLAVFTAEDDAAVHVTESGKATLKRRGRHNVIVRFLTEVVAITLTAPVYDEPIDLSDAPRVNFIDDEINRTLAELRIPPSPPADVFTLLRRLHLDLTGKLPTREEIARLERFVDQGEPESKSKWLSAVVDELLASDEFTDYWTHQFGQWLRVGPAGTSPENAQSYHDWVRLKVERHTPLNEMAADLVTASGSGGPANFYRAAPDARGQAEYFSEVLMGVRLRCANCHNHPLDRWTQDDYHGLAAVFVTLEKGKTIRYTGRGEVSHPATGDAAVAKLPGGEFLMAAEDHRPALARWLTSEANPHFARAMANRLWHAMLGRGLVEPIDDFRATNPATHSELLDRLAEDFIAHDFDFRHTLRQIVTSAAYARSSNTTKKNALDNTYYSHALRKPHPAEVLFDIIQHVTDVEDDKQRESAKRYTINLPGPAIVVPELAVLGQCDRKTGCDSSPTAGDITRQLALLNGDLLNQRIASPRGRLSRLIESKKPNAEIVRDVYLLALSRSPTDRESKYWNTQLATSSSDDRRARLEDFLWSVLSCDEFTHRY